MDHPKHVLASDTDSAYFTLTKLLQKLYPDSDSWPREKRIEVILKLTDKIQEKSNNNLDIVVKNLFNINLINKVLCFLYSFTNDFS